MWGSPIIGICRKGVFVTLFTTAFYKTDKFEGNLIKPTHKRLTFMGVNIDKVVNGKIVEHGGSVNAFETLFEQSLIKPV